MKKVAYTLITSAVLACCAMFALPTRAHAQCTATSAVFRTPTPVLQTTWYTDATLPYVYVDIQTAGCTTADLNFQFSLTDLDDDEDLDNGNDDDVIGLDNREIQIVPGFPNFTIALRAGEAECGVGDTPDCNYYIRVNDDTIGGVNSWEALPVNQKLSYDCDGVCGQDWSYLGIIPYMALYPTPFPTLQCGTTVSPGGLYPACCSGTTVDSAGWGWQQNMSCYLPQNTNNNTNTTTTGGTTNDTVDAIVIQINNPLTGIDSVMQFIKKILDLAVTIGVPILAIFIMYSGFLFITARGDMSKIKDAKNTLLNAIIGGAILLGAWVIAQAIKNTVAEIVASISSFIG